MTNHIAEKRNLNPDGHTAKVISMKTSIQIPGYKILRELGHGGMAHVYLAVQESFGREVALKILSPHLTDDPQFSKRFLREIKIVSQLNHPNIVTVYDAGKQGNFHYMSMEYIKGKELKHVRDNLSRREVIDIVKDVARALDYAGNKGIVHRDIKPENIMISDTDKRVVLMDFGIAHGDDLTHGMTQTGKAIGTPHFMSPEQTKGLKVDHRSDIYSLGVVFFQLLSGHLPYDASSAVAVGIKHLTAPIPTLPPGLEIFQPIINTCLSKQPEHRYQKAADLITALDKISDTHLAAIKSQAKVVTQKNVDHDAATQISGATTPAKKKGTPSLVFPTNRRNTSQESENKKGSGRRTALLLFLLGLTVAWAGTQKQKELTQFWGDIFLPEVDRLLPGMVPNDYLAKWQGTTKQPTVTPVQSSVKETPTAEETSPAPVVKKDRLTLLKEGLDDNPENAVEISTIYKGMLGENPGNPVARQGLRDLREWTIQQIRLAVATEDMKLARTYIDLVKNNFPRAANNKKVQRLDKIVTFQEKLNSHLEQAERYYQSGALSKPRGANALAEVKRVLALAPNNQKARDFLVKLEKAYYDKATELQVQGNISNAILMLEEGISVLPSKQTLVSKRTELKKQVQHNQHVTELFKHAEKLYQSGRLIRPVGNNAYETYQKILAKEKDNIRASAALKTIHQEVARKIQKTIREGRLGPAELYLQDAIAKYGKTPLLANAELKLKESQDARLPKILSVRLDNKKVTSLTGPDNNSLNLNRSLFAGFSFTNFETTTTLVQATLLDGAGKVRIAQKPVIVTGKTGQEFFDINLPVGGFAEGSYKLELSLKEKVLASKSFLVKPR